MAYDKVVDSVVLDGKLKSIADAIREKTGTTNEMTLEQMAEAVTGMEVGGGLRDIIENGFPETLYDADADSVCSELFAGYDKFTSIDFPNVEGVGLRAFSHCEKLRSINLPKVAMVRPEAFYGCKNLEELYLPECSIIGNSAFGRCTGLKTVKLPNIDSYISQMAFVGCTALERVEFGKAPINGIYEYAFGDCSSLTVIICRDTENVMRATVESIEGTPITAGQGFIYIHASMWDAYTAVYGDYMVMFRKIEDYPEICNPTT